MNRKPRTIRGPKMSDVLTMLAGKSRLARRMSDVEDFTSVPTIFRSFNRATSVGGAPLGCTWLIHGPPAAGKCLGRGTLVLTHDGRQVAVEDVRIGDVLLGPDSRPRKVLALGSGRGPLYRIEPERGEPWVCNDAHILTLRRIYDGVTTIEDVPLETYLSGSDTFRAERRQFSVGVEWDWQGRTTEPYFLGAWFGDGRKDLESVQLSKPDPEIRQLCWEVAARFDCTVTESDLDRCPSYRIVNRKGAANPLLDWLREMVGPDAMVPRRYLLASRNDRLEFLAGWLDTDGYRDRRGYEITQKRKDYAEAVCFLARSLGFYASMKRKKVPGYGDYWRCYIAGAVEEIPLRIERKRHRARPQPRKDPTNTRFKVVPLGEGEYFGFTLDGDGRFLMGDFTVTHNTAFMVGLIQSVQRVGGITAFIDAELSAETKRWFRAMGVDGDRCLYYGRTGRGEKKDPISYEEIVEETDGLLERYQAGKVSGDIKPGTPLLVVVDSISKMSPASLMKNIRGKDGGDALRAGVGRQQAQMNAAWLIALGPRIGDDDIIFAIIAHETASQASAGGAWTPDYKVRGGEALIFEAMMQVRVNFAGLVNDLAKTKDDERVPMVGKRHRFQIMKNKHGPALQTGVLYTATGGGLCPAGFDTTRELIHEAIGQQVVVGPDPKNLTIGSRFEFGGHKFTLKDCYVDQAKTASILHEIDLALLDKRKGR